MTTRYFLFLKYKGTDYCGWQRQPAQTTVQGETERCLSLLLRRETEVTGAGRTDTGVHASYYAAHFDAPDPIADPGSFVYHLNSLLPHDIAVFGIRRTVPDAHARFDATEREYRYRMFKGKDPFTREYTWQHNFRLDVDAMNEAAALLKEFDDFTTFAKLNSANKTNICRVTHAAWEECGGELVFIIRADRFLRNMVRAITGTLVDVGRGKLSPGRFGEIVAARDLSLSGSSAPAQGLSLSNITYPSEIFIEE